MNLRRVSTACLLALCLVMCVIASAVGADPAVPGVSVGKVRLGDTRANVIKKLGKPSKSTQWRSGPFQDTWLGPKPPNDKYGSPVSERIFLHVIYRNSKVVQVEFNSPKFVTPAGISMRSSLAQFRAKYKNPRVRAYTYDDPGGGGYVGYYYDDVKSGIAFTFGVQDNFDARITPEALRIHLRGIPVLPNPGGKPTKANDEIPVGPAEQ